MAAPIGYGSNMAPMQRAFTLSRRDAIIMRLPAGRLGRIIISEVKNGKRFYRRDHSTSDT